MNRKRILRTLGILMMMEAAFMLPCIVIALIDADQAAILGFSVTAAALTVPAALLLLCSRGASREFYARDGFFMVAVSWIILSAFGAAPFVISGYIPSPVDAFFESVSGFTTTAASVVPYAEMLCRACLYWRCFSNWLGGMGILVFLLAVIPASRGDGTALHILRAESPGPDVSKLTPKMRTHALILYVLYMILTAMCFISLLAGGMPAFDSLCHALATAGTGGFGIRTDSLASYAPHLQNIVAVFMVLFGINFNIYYLIMLKKFRAIAADEELRIYFIIIAICISAVAVNCIGLFMSFFGSLRVAGFTVISMITTTGFTVADYGAWPQLSQTLLLGLMLVGGSAGSTSGGIKISRIILIAKSMRCELARRLHPRSVKLVKINSNAVSEVTLNSAHVFIAAYAAIAFVSMLVVSLDNFSMGSNVSAVISCISNIGPAFGRVGYAGNYTEFSVLSKLVLSADMLLGRLELIPLMVLLRIGTWRRV